MNPLAAYIPQDRCHALACGTPLPDHTRGAALFADISGFTPLTEALRLALGPRQGSEALTDQINTTYDALIAQVDAFHGSVIGFAGDAITCWFDAGDGPAARRAVACAVGMQRAMAVFAQIVLPGDIHSSLALKVAVACGPARRMVAGDPAIQMLDLLAGATVARVATAEHHAVAGEIVLDAACVVELGAAVSIGAWREDAETGEQFAPLHDLTDIPPTSPWSELSADALTSEVLRPWLLPAAYAREMAGYGAFLTELRPAVALFLRFSGIDYDTDPNAHLRLDTFIRSVQSVLARFGSALLQVIIGDKGSYLCCAFGAPVAHEDDARRAVLAALALPHEAASAAALPPLQIGISQGVMRCGAYGSTSRRTYGILGDEVNLAARLMSVAAPGETIVCGGVRTAVAARMTLEPRPPVQLKGTAEPLPIFAVSGLRHERAVRLPEPTYALPMVGRTDELATVSRVLDHALGGRGSVLGITAEAGLGKSRLVAELVRVAHQRGMVGYGGACQAMDTRSPYVVWQPIWRAIFDLDPEAPLRRQLRVLEGLVEDWAPERVAATPLLGPLLGIALPENDFTHSLAPKDRQSALHALLRDCLGAVAREAHANGGGLLLILEDSHWLDAASITLLGDLTQGIAELPVLVVLAYRPPAPPQPAVLLHAELPNFTHLSLEGLAPPAAAQLIRAKLLHLFPARSGAVPPALVTQLMERTQGNPFYLEEVLSYLHDRGIDPREEGALDALTLPDSLHRLILSRLDQLSAQQQVILKASSVIGRRFLVAWLRGAFPTLAPPEGLADDLAHLSELELTRLDTPEPELAYLFKHIVTREVAYESLGSATRATLHGQLAAYLEQVAGTDVAGLLDVLAYHYEQSDDLAKKREYLRRAGEAAAARYANTAAISYLSRALELAPPDDLNERYALLLAREQIYALRGEREAQRADLLDLEDLAEALGERWRRAEVALRWSAHREAISDYPAAVDAARRTLVFAEDDPARQAAARRYWGTALWRQGDYAGAQMQFETALALARTIKDYQIEREILSGLGVVAYDQGHLSAATTFHEHALTRARAISHRPGEAKALNNLGCIAVDLGDYLTARTYYEQSLAISRIIGDQQHEAMVLANLGGIAYEHGDYRSARALYTQVLSTLRIIEDQQGQATALSNSGMIAYAQGLLPEAKEFLEQALVIAQMIGGGMVEIWARINLGYVLTDMHMGDQSVAMCQEAITRCHALGHPGLLAECRAGLAYALQAQGNLPAALSSVERVLDYLETGTLDGVESPMRAYLSCCTVLRAADDDRAGRLLERAHTELTAQAARMSDADQRMFLEQVPWNRAIMALRAEQQNT